MSTAKSRLFAFWEIDVQKSGLILENADILVAKPQMSCGSLREILLSRTHSSRLCRFEPAYEPGDKWHRKTVPSATCSQKRSMNSRHSRREYCRRCRFDGFTDLA